MFKNVSRRQTSRDKCKQHEEKIMKKGKRKEGESVQQVTDGWTKEIAGDFFFPNVVCQNGCGFGTDSGFQWGSTLQVPASPFCKMQPSATQRNPAQPSATQRNPAQPSAPNRSKAPGMCRKLNLRLPRSGDGRHVLGGPRPPTAALPPAMERLGVGSGF